MSDHAEIRVFIIDDDEDDLVFISDLLNVAGSGSYDISMATSVKDAKAILEKNKFDICIVDHFLGAGNGIDLIKDLTRTSDIPCILMTGAQDSKVERLALAAGAVDYLDKQDIRASNLARAIRFTLEVARRRKLEREHAAELIQEVHAERSRVGREIHDGLGQELHGISFLLRSWANSQTGDEVCVSRGDMEQLDEYVQGSISSVRGIIRSLSPVDDAVGGLGKALDIHAQRLRNIYSVTVDVNVDSMDLPAGISQHLLRVIQEASSNAIRHGRAGSLSISVVNEGSDVVLTHSDDGCGFEFDHATDGQGLENMRFRLRQLDAELKVVSSAGNGCTVSARLRATSP